MVENWKLEKKKKLKKLLVLPLAGTVNLRDEKAFQNKAMIYRTSLSDSMANISMRLSYLLMTINLHMPISFIYYIGMLLSQAIMQVTIGYRNIVAAIVHVCWLVGFLAM